jgi:hypothetical protein
MIDGDEDTSGLDAALRVGMRIPNPGPRRLVLALGVRALSVAAPASSQPGFWLVPIAYGLRLHLR